MQLQFLHKTALNSFAFSVFSYTLQAESTAVSFPPPLSKSLRGRPPAAAAAFSWPCRKTFLMSAAAEASFRCESNSLYSSNNNITSKTIPPDHESHNLLLRRRPSRGRPRGRHLQHNEVDPRVDRVQAGLPGGMRAQARGAKADQKIFFFVLRLIARRGFGRQCCKIVFLPSWKQFAFLVQPHLIYGKALEITFEIDLFSWVFRSAT